MLLAFVRLARSWYGEGVLAMSAAAGPVDGGTDQVSVAKPIGTGGVMSWRERITVSDSVLAGKPIIKGTRISVEFVIDLLARGWTVDQVLREYDHLAHDDVQACLAYASEVLRSERVYLVHGA